MDKLDRVFSQYIRLRDRLPGTDYCRCISCGKIQKWSEMDCGHYVNRKHISTRWDERNCNSQCRECNRFSEGNVSGYTLGLIKKYGKNIIELLHNQKLQTIKLSKTDIQALYVYYSKKVKELT